MTAKFAKLKAFKRRRAAPVALAAGGRHDGNGPAGRPTRRGRPVLACRWQLTRPGNRLECRWNIEPVDGASDDREQPESLHAGAGRRPTIGQSFAPARVPKRAAAGA